MKFSLHQILALITHYKYVIIFPWAVVEGPIITVISGFLASLGQLNFFVVYAIIVVADLVGDSLYYAIGRWGGRPFIRRWGRYLGIKEERLAQGEDRFHKSGGKILAIGKFHALGSLILTAAGLAKMDFRKFLWWNFFPTLIKSLVLLLIGYFFGAAYETIDKYLKDAGVIMIGLTIVIIAVYWILKKRQSKKLP